MSAMLSLFQTIEHAVFSYKRDFSPRHPWLLCLLVVIILPILLVGAVAVTTSLVMLPLAWLFGWL